MSDHGDQRDDNELKWLASLGTRLRKINSQSQDDTHRIRHSSWLHCSREGQMHTHWPANYLIDNWWTESHRYALRHANRSITRSHIVYCTLTDDSVPCMYNTMRPHSAKYKNAMKMNTLKIIIHSQMNNVNQTHTNATQNTRKYYKFAGVA